MPGFVAIHPRAARRPHAWLLLGLLLLPLLLRGAPSLSDTLTVQDAFADDNGDGVPDRLGTTVSVTGVVTSTPTPVGSNSALAALQDGTGGVTLYTPQANVLVGRIHRGDLVEATGEVELYRGGRELVLTSVTRLGAGIMPEPKRATVAEIAADRFPAELVRLEGTIAPESDGRDGLMFRDPTGEIRVSAPPLLLADQKFRTRFRPGAKLQLVGVVWRTSDHPPQNSIVPRDPADFQFAVVPPYRTIAVIGAFAALVAMAWLAIARRRAAERRVREMTALMEKSQRLEEELEHFFAVSLDMLCIAGADGRFKRINPAFTETLGWSVEELLARPVVAFIHPDDAEATARQIATAARETVTHFENRYRHQNGTWRTLSWKSVPDRHGTIYATARDVTDLRTTEAALRALNEQLEERVNARTAEVREALTTLDAIEDAAFIFDPASLQFRYVNRGAVRQLGYDREQLLARRLYEINPEMSERQFRVLTTALQTGDVAAQQLTTVHRRQDGQDVPVEINLQFVAGDGLRPRFIAVARDITERRRNERMAQRTQRLESLGTLAGGVAHDLNNGLAPILMGMEMLKIEYPGGSRLVETCQASALRCAGMVRQLLTFAKGAEGAHVALALPPLMSEITAIIRSTFPKNITVARAWPARLPIVRGDPTQLHQVLLNLCVNARDAMPDGGTLTLEAQELLVDDVFASAVPEARAGRFVAVRVHDTGVGIPPEVIDRIFDPFFTTKGPDKGTGLGLSTVMGIVKGHRGFIHVTSRVGHGSTFSVFLPVTEEETSPASEAAAPKAFQGQGETVLLVDDEAPIREVAAEVLTRLNVVPVIAVDGTEGLVQVAQHRQALRAIITDLHMPLVDGLAFARAVRRMLPEAPIVVATGRLDPQQREEFRTLGVHHFLNKPFTEGELADALKAVLRPNGAS